MTTTEAEVNQAHREKMARIKAVKDRLYASKTIEKGLLIVHTGTGKGKSTAAWGLAMRCLGHGLKLGVVQFVKGRRDTGERHVLDRPDLDDASVVDQDVDSSEPLIRLRDRPLGVVPVSDITGHREHFGERLSRANVIDRAVKFIVAACHQRQPRPLMGQFARHDEPQTPGPAGNDHGLPGKVVIGAPPPRLRGQERANTNGAPDDQISFLLFRHSRSSCSPWA